MEKLSEKYGQYLPFFNHCNIPNRPYVDLQNFDGNHGNTNDIVQNYNIAMSNQGFEEEARYWGNTAYQMGFKKLEECKIPYYVLIKLIFSMCESSFENQIKSESGESFSRPEEKENDFPDTGNNCYGRSHIFYAKVNADDYEMDLYELLADYGHEILLEKDKLGMMPVDHYLLAGKYKEYIYAMQVFSVSATPEEKEILLNNEVFGYNFHKNITPLSISTRLSYILAQANEDNNKELITDYISYVLKAFNNYDQKLNDAKKSAIKSEVPLIHKAIKISAINVVKNVGDFSHMGTFNKNYERILDGIEDGLLKAFIGKYKEIDELNVVFEKRMIDKVIDSSKIEQIKKIQNRL